MKAVLIGATLVVGLSLPGAHAQPVFPGVYTYPLPDMIRDVTRHLQLVLSASALAILSGVPFGIVLTRPRLQKISPILMAPVYLGQTIPSFAVIALALPLVGIGVKAAVFALYVYALLPIVRNTYAGIRGIDPNVIESALGMGMTRMQIFRKVEIPLAMPVIMAGIRISVVVTVGTAALGALIGAGGLGSPIFVGLNFFNLALTFKGAALAAGMAMVLDTLLAFVESRLTPKGVKVETSRSVVA